MKPNSMQAAYNSSSNGDTANINTSLIKKNKENAGSYSQSLRPNTSTTKVRRASRMNSGNSHNVTNPNFEEDLLQKQQQALRTNQMVDQIDFIAEMEERLFGSKVRTKDQLYISDKDFVPLKTGIEDQKVMKYGPKHIMDADDYEPLYIHQENILEDCLNREAE